MNELTKLIRTLYPVSDEAANLLNCYARNKSISKGDALIVKGEVNSHLYILRKGLLRFYSINEDGDKEDTICFAMAGETIASLHSYFAGLPAICTIEALSDSELFEFSKEDMETIFKKSLDLANWARIIAFEKMYALERRYMYIGTGDAFSRYKSFINMRPAEIIRHVQLRHIASYLKITPQTLSRIRRRFAKE